MMKRSVVMLVAAAMVLGGWCSQSHATAFGTLSNFDVVNDTGHECHGFEIELEDCRPSDVPYTFGGSYIRYDVPEVLDTTIDPAHPRTLVRYRHWNGTQWEATPVAPAGVSPSGHDCYAGGPIGNYATSGCEHYGVSLNVNPSKTTYRWLVAGNPADVGSAFSVEPQAVQIPVPVWNVLPQPVVGGGAAPVDVRAEVEPIEEANAAQYGPPQWMKVFKIELARQLQPADLNLLLLGVANGIVPGEAEVETEWKVIQSKPGNAEGDAEDADVKEDPLDAGKHSVVRRYEFYAYTGPRDPENNEVQPCINDDQPVAADAPVDGCSDLGDFVGAQNVAVDVELATADAELPTGEVGVPYAGPNLAFGGVAPYAVALTDGALPDSLTLVPATGALAGTPTSEGTFVFSIHAEDHVLAAVDGTFTLTIVPAVTIATDALAAVEVDQCSYEAVSVIGGVEPYTWSDISGQLPAWAYTSDGSDVGGCPTVGDEGVTHLSFTVTDALGASATKELDLVVTGPQPTATETPAPVSTETPVPTQTALPTATTTPVPSATATPVPTVTATQTPLPTATQTAVPTATATAVPTVTATTTAVPTATTTARPSATATPVRTATPTPIATAVAGTLKIKNDELEDGDVGHRYSDTLQLTKGGVPPYAWTATGLPSGLILNAASGIISGRPLVAGRFVVLIGVSDAAGKTGAKSVRLRIE